MEVFEGMDILLKTYWYIAIPITLIFIIQTIMTFVGADAYDGVDADFDGDLSDTGAPFQLFSLRNLTNLLMGFSWSGICFYSSIENKTILIIVSTVVALLFVYLFFVIIKQVQKLAEDNTFKIQEAVNKTAEVYINIPAKMGGIGKVLVSVKGSVKELNAATKGDESIESSSVVKVVSIESENLLIVEKI